MREADEILVRDADWVADGAALTEVRRRVFIDEQRVPERLEWDGEDQRAQHWLAAQGARVVATARMRAGGHIGRMAVLKAYRRAGIGSRLLQCAIAAARAQGLAAVHLHAQLQAMPFYARHGFSAVGEVFLDAGIPHREMWLRFDREE